MLNIIQIWVSLNSFYTMAALPVEELSMNLGFTPFLCCTRIAWLPIHCTQEEIYYWFRQSCCIFLSQDHMMLAQHFKVHQYGINFIDIIKWDTKVNVSVLCINHRIILTHQLQHVLHLLFSTPLLHCTYIYIYSNLWRDFSTSPSLCLSGNSASPQLTVFSWGWSMVCSSALATT